MMKLKLSLCIALFCGVLGFGTSAFAIDMSTTSDGAVFWLGWSVDSDTGTRDPPQTQRSFVEIERSWDGNYVWAASEGRADIALRVPGATNILPRAEVPASVQARSYAMALGNGYGDTYAGCGGLMLICPSVNSSASSTARASHVLTYVVAPGAPAAAHATPIPVDVYAN